jgi:hypothetical protein
MQASVPGSVAASLAISFPVFSENSITDFGDTGSGFRVGDFDDDSLENCVKERIHRHADDDE